MARGGFVRTVLGLFGRDRHGPEPPKASRSEPTPEAPKKAAAETTKARRKTYQVKPAPSRTSRIRPGDVAWSKIGLDRKVRVWKRLQREARKGKT